MKNNSLRFTKYNVLINNFNKNKDLILLEHARNVIYLSNKKDPIYVE